MEGCTVCSWYCVMICFRLSTVTDSGKEGSQKRGGREPCEVASKYESWCLAAHLQGSLKPCKLSSSHPGGVLLLLGPYLPIQLLSLLFS